ncbi:hypothetical protein [uncultured Corynebacterium sp.]|uniref:hypothetical protein n=1 Tax=uncultured Corynebacterium sp. TaxID=159447 RepID=UPI0028D355E0|nr:hypothetical protein [uncultured Corynebacterium sp.]
MRELGKTAGYVRNWGCGLRAAGPARLAQCGEIDLAALRRAGWTRRVATAVPDWQ